MAATLDPRVLAWALALPADSPFQPALRAYLGGTLRVSINGQTVEYRSAEDIAGILQSGFAATNTAARRPRFTLVQFGPPPSTAVMVAAQPITPIPPEVFGTVALRQGGGQRMRQGGGVILRQASNS